MLCLKKLEVHFDIKRHSNGNLITHLKHTSSNLFTHVWHEARYCHCSLLAANGNSYDLLHSLDNTKIIYSISQNNFQALYMIELLTTTLFEEIGVDFGGVG